MDNFKRGNNMVRKAVKTHNGKGKGKEEKKDSVPVPSASSCTGKARRGVSEKAEERPIDPWQVDLWTLEKLQDAYHKLKNDPKYYDTLSSKQQQTKFNNLAEKFNKASEIGDPKYLAFIRKFFKELQKQKHECPVRLDDVKKCDEEKTNDNLEAKKILKFMDDELTPAQTKRMLLLKEDRKTRPVHQLEKEGSTVTRIIEHFKSDPNSKEISKAQKAIDAISVIDGSKPRHYLARIRGSKEKMFFYGTSEGQRMHVQAAKLADSTIEWSAEALEDAVTREMAPNEKETWMEVSNYWLAGSKETQLGMVGERMHGLKEAGGRTYSDECLQNGVLISSLNKSDVSIGVDSPKEGKKGKKKEQTPQKIQPDSEKALFLSNFRTAQTKLDKNWVQDVNRETYKDKPGNKVPASGSSSEPASGDPSLDPSYYDDLICRRMCKWILHLAAYNGESIIYALDTIDLGASAEAKLMEIPDNVSNKGRKLKVPVCTSELREVFRYLDKLTNVEFYQELLPVDTPWGKRQDPAIQKSWAEYAMHLMRKMLLLYPGDALCLTKAEEMLGAWKKESWSEVIACYKAINSSELLTPVFPVTEKQVKKHDDRIALQKEALSVIDKETASKYGAIAFQIQHSLRVSIIPNVPCSSGAASVLNSNSFFPVPTKNALPAETKMEPQAESAASGSSHSVVVQEGNAPRGVQLQ